MIKQRRRDKMSQMYEIKIYIHVTDDDHRMAMR